MLNVLDDNKTSTLTQLQIFLMKLALCLNKKKCLKYLCYIYSYTDLNKVKA